MRTITSTIILSALLSLGVSAQNLPKPSPDATVEQRVGMTDVSITYSRPGVKDRAIWGDLVAYDEIWRAGANKATKVSFSTPVKVDGVELAAGDYSLFIIPSKEEAWTVIFNNNTELWGTGDYKQEEDALRIKVKASTTTYATERLEYHFTQVNMIDAVLSLDWAMIQLNLNMATEPKEMISAEIDRALNEAEEDKKWRVYRNAAHYAGLADMVEQGLKWMEESLELHQDSWYSYWVYAELLADNGNYEKAIEQANVSIKKGKEWSVENEKPFKYEDDLNEDIQKWSTK